MAKARAIVKRRKSIRNIRKITKTMQLIATAKFQKSLKRSVATKPYIMKIREIVTELAATVDNVQHPLMRRPGVTEGDVLSGRAAVIVLTSNRGLAGGYNGSVLRTANAHLRRLDAAGTAVQLYVSGKKGISYFKYQKRPLTGQVDQQDPPRYADFERHADTAMRQFTRGEVDAVYVVYMNFVSTGVQRPEVLTLLPLSGLRESLERISLQVAEKEAQAKAGALDARRRGDDVIAEAAPTVGLTTYDFSPSVDELVDELLPLTIKTSLWQTVLDAATSEHIARMVAMKTATDSADKLIKKLTMQYNRARQGQITTELAEIMGGVESMKGRK
jgi:F-type H+-transporting ATPase subunit gamma